MVEDPLAEVTPPLGAAAEQVTVSLQAEYQIAQVKKTDLIAAARSGLEANLAPGLAPVDADIEVHVEHAQLDEDLWALTVTAQQALIPLIDRANLQTSVSGLDLNQAQAVLSQQYSLTEPAQFHLWPAWWPRIPFFAARLTLNTMIEIKGRILSVDPGDKRIGWLSSDPTPTIASALQVICIRHGRWMLLRCPNCTGSIRRLIVIVQALDADGQ